MTDQEKMKQSVIFWTTLLSQDEQPEQQAEPVAQSDLIKRLRDTASKGVSVWGDLQMEAAREIEILTAERDCYASAMDRMLAAPPQRKPLTWERISQIGLECANDKSRLPFEVKLARAIEQAHGIKETP